MKDPNRNPSELTIVRRAPPARARSGPVPAWLALAALVAVAGVVAAANLTVNQRTDQVALFAERFNVGDAFVVEGSAVAPAPASAPALGFIGSAIEMSKLLPAARTALTADHWVYSATVKEKSANAVLSGDYVAELTIDGLLAGSVYFTQGLPDADNEEGVKASFSVGPTINTKSLYFLSVKRLEATGPLVAYTLKTKSDLTWVGEGNGIDGVVNPTLNLNAGDVLKITAKNADGIVHNIGLKDGNGVLNPPGWSSDIKVVSDTTSISWQAATGTYTYACMYHPNTMKGDIVVA